MMSRNYFNFVVIFVMLTFINLHNGVNCMSVFFKPSPTKIPSGHKFLLILLDGYANHYLSKPGLDGFEYIKANGVHAQYMTPQFPSLSYPNYYSILTGLYANHHQIALNFMYNPETQELFDSSPSWWNKAEPLWTTTTKAGLRTHVFLWPGCEVTINKTKPEFCIEYSLKLWTNDFEDHLEEIVDKFANDEADVGFVYCEQPDFFGHIFGPNSPIVDATIRSLDKVVVKLLNNLAVKQLHNKVNVMFVSDHGMTSVGLQDAKKIPLSRFINLDDLEVILDHGAIVGLYPYQGKLNSVYERLKEMPGVYVWLKEDIPERFHFKEAITVPPIIILAKKGFYIKGVPKTDKQEPKIPVVGMGITDTILQGYHGYDPEGFNDMRGIFLAIGPAFKKGFTLGPIYNKDVYNLAAFVCGVPANSNDGNWESVVEALRINRNP